jgi:hypothetical protein
MGTTPETLTGAESDDAPKRKTLTLKRETVRDLSTELLTTQGWSLWTCDATVGDASAQHSERRR